MIAAVTSGSCPRTAPPGARRKANAHGLRLRAGWGAPFADTRVRR